MLPCWRVGSEKLSRIFIKWRKITSVRSFLREPLWRTPTDHGKSNRAVHVSKLFWAPLQYAAGMHTGVIRRGLLQAVMVNSERVSRCPWESRWTVTKGLSRISVTLSPWERPCRTPHYCMQHYRRAAKASKLTQTGLYMKVVLVICNIRHWEE